jgi:selenocysteine lyase/cysteine desulfurase
LDEVQTTENAEWLNLVLKDNPEKLEATSGNLLPIIVKAIQELKSEKDVEIAELYDRIKGLENELIEIKSNNKEVQISNNN